MIFDEYKASYEDFVEALQQIIAINRVSTSLLRDFPNNLPKELHDVYNREVESLIVRIQDDHLEMKLNVEDVTVGPLIFLMFSRLTAGKKEKPNFDRVLSAQQLIMIFAYLEAFIADTMRAICKIQPNVMKSQKKPLTTESILATGDWDQLIESLVDEYVYESGWKKDVADRLESMKSQLGINLNITDEKISLLKEAENRRHVFIHNGGKASKRYLSEVGNTSLAVGESIPIDANYLSELATTSLSIVGEVFAVVSEKFFQVNIGKEHIAVWRTKWS